MSNYRKNKIEKNPSNLFNKSYKSYLNLLGLIALSGLTACNQTHVKKETQKEEVLSQPVVIESTVIESEMVDLAVKGVRTKVSNYKIAPRSSVFLKQTYPSVSSNFLSSPIDFSDKVEYINIENYENSPGNPVKQVSSEPVSTFSIDVDTGSYSNSRRFLNQGQLPPIDAVREEAFINYFNYNYEPPKDISTPFKVHSEVGTAPWNNERQLLKIGIKGFEIEKVNLKAANLVFLLDVSGSMNAADKLPLLKASLTMLSKQLDENDSVAIVVYAGAAGVVLPATAGNDHDVIRNALNQLSAGGSTNGGQGIELAYQIAEENFKKDGVNRVILATDGDFNVGIQSIGELKGLIAQKRKTGIALTTLGFGQGNYNDALMEQLANIGNGQHAYIDTLNEARKVLVDEIGSTMQIIAKDVKVQVEFNPQQVAEYRLIGYQNRLLATEDFNNDKVDAAELGAGHTVTALYEITLVDAKNKHIDDLRYQTKTSKNVGVQTLKDEELAYVKVRYKQPDNDSSNLITESVSSLYEQDKISNDFKFSAAVAGFAQLLKGGKYTGQWQYENCIDLAIKSKGNDPFGYRAEFIQLVRTAKALQ